MVSFFRRKKPEPAPETPSATDSTRHYSVEELAAAFPAPAARPAPAEDEPTVAADESAGAGDERKRHGWGNEVGPAGIEPATKRL